jgi:hypothetical protein
MCAGGALGTYDVDMIMRSVEDHDQGPATATRDPELSTIE